MASGMAQTFPSANTYARHDAPEVYRGGYAAVAAWIARDCDDEPFVFRRFNALAARNLLYLQSELIELEAKLKDSDIQILAGLDTTSAQSARTWETLVESVDGNRHEECELMKLVLEMRLKIKEYHEALLLQNKIARLSRPTKRVVKLFRSFLYGEDEADFVLGGKAKRFLDKEIDLVSLQGLNEDNLLNNLLQTYWPFPSQKSQVWDPVHQTRHFAKTNVDRVVVAISVVLATVLLIGAMTSLYFVRQPGNRLAMVSVYTLLFAVTISLLTTAKRGEVFGATAAYAAVLVVYISGNIGID